VPLKAAADLAGARQLPVPCEPTGRLAVRAGLVGAAGNPARRDQTEAAGPGRGVRSPALRCNGRQCLQPGSHAANRVIELASAESRFRSALQTFLLSLLCSPPALVTRRGSPHSVAAASTCTRQPQACRVRTLGTADPRPAWWH
jgi:hypothetical protein